MNSKLTQALRNSLETGFIDQLSVSDALYQPELLTNKKAPPTKVLSTILKELDHCSSFAISVAFVTTSGVATLIESLAKLEKRGVQGRLLVSQYLNFTQPEALRRLARFSNIDLRITTKGNAHAKGYIFERASHINFIIGSSNLTASALATNLEWNLKVSALRKSSIAEKIYAEFEADFDRATIVTPAYIITYELAYQQQFLRLKNNAQLDDETPLDLTITPNSMQVEALENLAKLRAESKQKGLLISATGTGKTYLSAFDAKAAGAKKLLFVVHRRNIAEKAMKSFRTVFGSDKTMGLYSGKQQELDKDFIFSTVQTISREQHLQQFDPAHFDYIIIDESHRSGAASYRRLLDYFTPAFLLGMTATPERTDGNDIFRLFDHNIAYEIRLNRAMEEDMLSQFHYYGVTDITVGGIELEEKADFKLIAATERVNNLIEKAEFYGSDNGITRGLVFCSGNPEAQELSLQFNQRGYQTLALSSHNSEAERNEAIRRLETDDLTEKLDYIFTVDIFNEGIDIPSLNQVIMIRPTNSAIIFIQQLGRGLRKTAGKHYLTVIDFIGNYQNNYLIPIALYGETSYNKDKLRKLLSEGSRLIPGASTINFDEISREKIFKSINAANLQLLADLKSDFFQLKHKLGRVPLMMDFINYGARDPYLFVEHSKSYYNFVQRVDRKPHPLLSEDLANLLSLFSREINNGKRVEESLILQALIEHGELSVAELNQFIEQTYGYTASHETLLSCANNLNFGFVREKQNGRLVSTKEAHNLSIAQFDGKVFLVAPTFSEQLNDLVFRNYLIDSTQYSIHVFDEQFSADKWKAGFILYHKYSRKDVFRILNVSENPVAQNVGGYLVSKDNSHCPIFVNYHKEDDISASTKYEDEFINQQEFSWMSKSNRRKNSKDVQAILGSNGPIRLPLFVKKNNDEGKDFYYMGELSPNHGKVEETKLGNDHGKLIPVVRIGFKITPAVSESMYDYLNNNVDGHRNLNETTTLTQKSSEGVVKQLKPTVPFYDFYAAAGSFSEMQTEKEYRYLEVPEKYANSTDYFACEIRGESMNKIIPSGSVCLFRKYTGGSRNGKIVLIEHFDHQDPDFRSAFTIKTYTSEKIASPEGWAHKKIILLPNSYDHQYQPLTIDAMNAEGMRIVGEFVTIIA